jgi:hypothetical protein
MCRLVPTVAYLTSRYLHKGTQTIKLVFDVLQQLVLCPQEGPYELTTAWLMSRLSDFAGSAVGRWNLSDPVSLII